MWISALLVGACVLVVLATDTCAIDDLSSCGITPVEDACASPSLSRSARSAKYSFEGRSSRGRRSNRHRRPGRQRREVDNLSFIYDDGDDEDYMDLEIRHPHSSSTRTVREVEINDGMEDIVISQTSPPHHQVIDNDQPPPDHPNHHFREAHTKVCPHCNQVLPADLFHHPPVDPRVFRQYQQYPHLVSHPYIPPIAHQHFIPSDGDEDADGGFEDTTESPPHSPGLMYNQSVPMYNPSWAAVPVAPPVMMVAPGVVPPPAAPAMVPPPPPPAAVKPEVPIAEDTQRSNH